MSDLTVTIPYDGGDVTLPLPQAIRVGEAVKELTDRGEEPVWHFNHCGCCVSVHGRHSAGGWVIGEDGGADWHETAP